jgi:hypothetical protein
MLLLKEKLLGLHRNVSMNRSYTPETPGKGPLNRNSHLKCFPVYLATQHYKIYISTSYAKYIKNIQERRVPRRVEVTEVHSKGQNPAKTNAANRRMLCFLQTNTAEPRYNGLAYNVHSFITYCAARFRRFSMGKCRDITYILAYNLRPNDPLYDIYTYNRHC